MSEIREHKGNCIFDFQWNNWNYKKNYEKIFPLN